MYVQYVNEFSNFASFHLKSVIALKQTRATDIILVSVN